ncbi:MAG: DUF4266 domain-containing protein [bacterium]|nr:DUF4266 domain-containing protein [Gammaproteobacteria bacterium]HIL94857.1 DUF4266 domain-containing protein [Pseudomonadales bacterium]
MNRLILVMILLGLSSCQSVQPWERGALARPEMQLEVGKLGSALYRQVYFSKEASSGGSEVAGAGCGCN